MVGSKNRSHLLNKFTKKYLPSFTVIIEPQEEEAYRLAHPGLDFVVLPENDQGFAYMFNEGMLATAQERELKYFVFADDDIFGFYERSSMAFSHKKAADPAELIEQCVEMADYMGLSQLSLSHKGTTWGAKKIYQEPVGAWGVFVNRTDHVNLVGGFDQSLAIFNDFELSARLLNYGLRVGRTNLHSFDHTMRNVEGGLSFLYETEGATTEAVDELMHRYPGLVRRKRAHDQDEIRFNWRKFVAKV
jgi:hypothetical protein